MFNIEFYEESNKTDIVFLFGDGDVLYSFATNKDTGKPEPFVVIFPPTKFKEDGIIDLESSAKDRPLSVLIGARNQKGLETLKNIVAHIESALEKEQEFRGIPEK